jgi:peptidyl-dipeptidase A
LNYIIFIPWSAGVMTEFEYSLYAQNLPPDQYNAKWWELVQKYQGIVPPGPRPADGCDAATKTHINDDAGQYYDYAISYVLLFQLHDHIARNILKQDPHATNYYGSKEVGAFLTSILSPGGTRDWRELTREATGADLSAQAMLRYFEPLMAYLQEQNKGRTHTLPDL